MRLFVAGDLPAGIRSELERYARALDAAGGWRAVPQDRMHITLAFLGERGSGQVSDIAAALEGSVQPVAGLRLGSGILLPGYSPRVAAVRVEDAEGRLVALQAAVRDALVDRGVYRPERRPFLPHVTVARRGSGRRGTAEQPAWSGDAFGIEHVTLYSSRLTREGPRYEPLARFSP